MNRIKCARFLLLVGVLAFAGCKKSADDTQKNNLPATSAKTEVGKIRMAYQPIVFGMPVFVAQDQKFFEKNNLAVEAKSFTSANDIPADSLSQSSLLQFPASRLIPGGIEKASRTYA